MIRVEGIEKEYVLDFNDVSGNSVELLVVSKSGDGIKHSMWGVDLKSSDSVNTDIVGNNTLLVSIDVDNLFEDAYIWLRNMNGDKYKITVKPSSEATSNKRYEFRITSMFGASFKIRSYSNKAEARWECSYMGEPIDVSVCPTEGSGDTLVSVVSQLYLKNKANSFLEFTQDKSENKIVVPFSVSGDDVTLFNTYKNEEEE